MCPVRTISSSRSALDLTATTSSYGNLATIQRSLVYLGIDNIRDTTPGPSPNNRTLNAYLNIGSFTLNGHAYTTQFNLIAGTSLSVTMTYADKMASYVSYIEGPNEVNIVPITFVTAAGVTLTGRAAAEAYQQALYADVHGDPLLNNATHKASVMTFSLGPGTSYAGYGDVSAYTDYTNVHAYGQYGIPPNWFLQNEINAVTDSPGKPAIVTETGNYTIPNHDSGGSEDVQAKLLMDTLLDDFSNGVKLTYIYQLLDPYADPGNTLAEDHYGVFHADGTPKIAATAIHNLTTILQDSATNAQSFTPTPLAYSVTGLPSGGGGYQFAMEKSNGAYDIAVWREPWIWNKTTDTEITFAPLPVTVTFGQGDHTIEVFDPLSGTTPIATYHDVNTVNLALGTGPLIVEVEPQSGLVISTGSAGGVFNSTGADTILAGSGAATVNAGGPDTVVGSTGSLTVFLNEPFASLTGGAGVLTVTDNAGQNTIT